ncbi:MAG: hypothetical protein IJN03_01790 [Bacilli bacterium]|nr:hypothetical protein [Bacilli bacterium]
MKNFWKNISKNDIAKAIGAMILIAVILTWFIPYGYFSGATYYEYGMNRLGLTDLTTLGYYGAYFAIDKVTFLLILGGFYGLLSKTSAYQKITTSIAKKLKGKEIVSLVVTSVIVAGLTSISTSAYAILLFVPFLVSILFKMKLDRMSVFAATFGSILIGILGATFGTDSLIAFNNYYAGNLGTDVLGSTLIIRSVILLVSLVLFNFFNVLHAKKVLGNKKLEESKEDLFEVENNTDKKVKTLPLIIVLAIVSVISLLGIINWSGGFGIEVFNDFHTWLTELTIGKDITIFAYILGTAANAFGAWDLFTLCTLLFIASIVVAIICKVNFSDYLANIGNGFIRIGKPVLVLVGVYAAFIGLYMTPVMPTITAKLLPVSETPSINLDYKGSGSAYFNIDTNNDFEADYNLINQDTDKDGKCDLNCDTNKDGYPDKNLDFDADGEISKTDKELAEDIVGISSLNYDSDGNGVPDVNVTTEFSVAKTVLAAVITNLFHVDLGYTGYSVGAYLVSSFGAVALTIIFLIYLLVYGFLQLVAPTSVLLMVGLTYTKLDYKSWFKYAWIFLLSILVILAVLFVLLAVL